MKANGGGKKMKKGLSQKKVRYQKRKGGGKIAAALCAGVVDAGYALPRDCVGVKQA